MPDYINQALEETGRMTDYPKAFEMTSLIV